MTLAPALRERLGVMEGSTSATRRSRSARRPESWCWPRRDDADRYSDARLLTAVSNATAAEYLFSTAGRARSGRGCYMRRDDGRKDDQGRGPDDSLPDGATACRGYQTCGFIKMRPRRCIEGFQQREYCSKVDIERCAVATVLEGRTAVVGGEPPMAHSLTHEDIKGPTENRSENASELGAQMVRYAGKGSSSYSSSRSFDLLRRPRRAYGFIRIDSIASQATATRRSRPAP